MLDNEAVRTDKSEPYTSGGLQMRRDHSTAQMQKCQLLREVSWDQSRRRSGRLFIPPSHLQQYGRRIPIYGSGKNVLIVPGTLDGYLKQYIKTVTAGWVAVVLEKANVITIDTSQRAAYVKLP